MEAMGSENAELARAHEQIRNLQIALETSRRIGIAVGIVMAIRRVSAEEAFDALVAASQTRHRKIRDLAEDVMYTGELAPIATPEPVSTGSPAPAKPQRRRRATR